MGNPATVDDLTGRSLRPLSDTQQQVGGTLLDDAWNIILLKVPGSDERVIDDAAFRALVVSIECSMVLRVLANPDGKKSEQVDDYSFQLDASRAAGALYLSPDEAALLSTSTGISDSGFTIKPAGLGPTRARSYDQPWWGGPW